MSGDIDKCPGIDQCPYKFRCSLNNFPRTAAITFLVLGVTAFCWWARIEFEGRPPTVFEGIFAIISLVALAEDPIQFARLGRQILDRLFR